MKLPAFLFAIAWLCASCGATYHPVRLTEDWPATILDYREVVQEWTRRAELRADYQEVCELVATLKSPDWRASHAVHDAEIRGLTGDARAQYITQARADVAGPF